jgi:hypothetical protein
MNENSYSSFTRSNSGEDDASYVYVYEDDSSDEEELKTPPQQLSVPPVEIRTPSPLPARPQSKRNSQSYPTMVETLTPSRYNSTTQSWENQSTVRGFF